MFLRSAKRADHGEHLQGDLPAAETFSDGELERVRVEETGNNTFEYAGEEL